MNPASLRNLRLETHFQLYFLFPTFHPVGEKLFWDNLMVREIDALSVTFLALDADFVYLHNPSTECQHPTC